MAAGPSYGRSVHRGTSGSNPGPSSSESATNRAVAGKLLVAAWFGGGRDRLIATMPVKTAFDQRDWGRGLASGVLA